MGDGAREAVEQCALVAEAGCDHGNDNFIGDELAVLHDGFGLFAEVAAGGDFGAQHVASREVGQSVFFNEEGGLGAFA